MAPAYTSSPWAEGEEGVGKKRPSLSYLSAGRRFPPPRRFSRNSPYCPHLPGVPAPSAPSEKAGCPAAARLPRGSVRCGEAKRGAARDCRRRGLPSANQPGPPGQRLLRPAVPRRRRLRGSGNTRAFPNAAPAGRERENISTEIADVFRRQVVLGSGGRGGPEGGGTDGGREESYGTSRCLPKGEIEGRWARRKQPMFPEGRVAREQRGQRGRSVSERAEKSRR